MTGNCHVRFLEGWEMATSPRLLDFCSCERVLNPALNGKPVIVLSNNDGVVVARTKEAKALGIGWDPFHLIQRLIKEHDVRYFSSNYPFYKEMSGRVMHILSGFTPKLEHYSVDEAFLDLTGMENRDSQARHIKQTIQQWTGIPVSIGIGKTRTLAKVANRLAKKSKKAEGVLDLSDSPYLDLALSRTSVADIWGVGRRWSEKMEQIGIKTALELKNTPDHILMKRFNSVVLMRTVYELRGVSCVPAIAPVVSKSIMSSLSFGGYVETLTDMKQAIAMHATQAAQKMRGEGLTARGVYVFIKTNKYREYGPQYSNSIKLALPYSTDLTSELIQAAMDGLEHIFRAGYLYSKAGVMFYDLCPADEIQVSLLNPYDREQVTGLMAAVDILNTRYGPGTLRYGAEGFNKRWKMRQNHLSDKGGMTSNLSQFQQMKPVNEFGMSLQVIRAL